MAWLVDDQVLERVRRIPIDFGRYGVDRFGTTQVDVARMHTILGWFYRNYFRVTVEGIENVPAEGRGMLIGNHSGGVALDATMIISSLFWEMEPPRLAHGMVEKFLGRTPFAAMMTSRAGQLTGLPEHAVRLMEDERLLLVFPEGARGTAKLYGDRNTLVRFGTGFMRIALETGAPIIPFAFLGGGDAIPTVLNLYKLGKLLGAPYIPVTPYLLPLPRPVPLEIYYGEPMHFDGDGTEEDSIILGYVDQVKERIADMIDRGARRRRNGGAG